MRRDTLLALAIFMVASGCGGLPPEGWEGMTDMEEMAADAGVVWGEGIHALDNAPSAAVALSSHEQAIFGSLFGDLLIGLGGQLIGKLIDGGGSKGQP